MPPPRARFGAAARRDLRAIVESTIDEWGPEQAQRYRRSLQATCDRLAAFPEMAPVSSDLGDIRVFPSGRHRILYRPDDRGIRVLRFIHQKASLENLSFD